MCGNLIFYTLTKLAPTTRRVLNLPSHTANKNKCIATNVQIFQLSSDRLCDGHTDMNVQNETESKTEFFCTLKNFVSPTEREKKRETKREWAGSTRWTKSGYAVHIAALCASEVCTTKEPSRGHRGVIQLSSANTYVRFPTRVCVVVYFGDSVIWNGRRKGWG